MTDASKSQLKSHAALLTVALAASIAVGALSGAYGVWSGSLLATALALQAALVAVATWAAIDAEKIRRRSMQSNSVESEKTETTGDEDSAAGELAEAKSMHYLFLAAPTGIIAFLCGLQLLTSRSTTISTADPAAAATAVGVITLVLGCLWLVFAQSFQAIDAGELPEKSALARAFREAQWVAIAAAVGSFAVYLDPIVSMWVSRLILAWTLAVAIEQILRAGIGGLATGAAAGAFVAPISLFLREAFLAGTNPINSAFDAIESRFGLSFRSSWAIRFTRIAAGPLVLLLGVLAWSTTSVAIIAPQQLGVLENFGRPAGTPLQPGLHFKLPWPLSTIRRVPVKTVSALQVGFVDAPPELTVGREAPRALIWSRAHEQEFSLVLGDGTELIAVNAIVYYKIGEKPDEVFDYVYQTQNPKTALESYAYRVLMELTRSSTLAEILSANRIEFAGTLERSLDDYCRQNRLGLEIVDVAIVNLHPPVEVAVDYVDVISAQIDAERLRIEAEGYRLARLEEAEAERSSLVSDAQREAAIRTSRAAEETSRFTSLQELHAKAPTTVEQKLWQDCVEAAISGKRLYLLDRSLAATGRDLIFDVRSSPTDSPQSPRRVTE